MLRCCMATAMSAHRLNSIPIDIKPASHLQTSPGLVCRQRNMQDSMQQDVTLTMQQYMLISNDHLHFQPQRPWLSQPLERSSFCSLFASANVSHDGLARNQGLGLRQEQGRPSTLARTKSARARMTRKGPQKLFPATASQVTPKPTVVACHGNEWLADLLQRLKKKNKLQVCGKGTPRERLEGLLGQDGASWLLASVTLPETTSDTPSLHSVLETIAPCMIHISGTIVYADLADSQEVFFKLNDQTVAALWDYHDSVHCIAMTADMFNDGEAALARLKMKEHFRQATNDFTFRTGVGCLEETEADGSGELCWVRPEKVKSAILALFQYLPPKMRHPVSEGTSQSER